MGVRLLVVTLAAVTGAHALLPVDIPKQTDYIIKNNVETCPSVGYYFKMDLPNSLTPGVCYLCFCQPHNQAICWRRRNHHCDALHYHHHGVGSRHTLPASALHAITGVTIPKELKPTRKPSMLDSALTAVGYEKIQKDEPETFPEEKSSSFLNKAMAAVGYDKLKEGESPNPEFPEEKVEEPGLLEKAMSILGGYVKEQGDDDDYLSRFQDEKEDATEKPGFIERAMSSLGFGKRPVEDWESRVEFPEEVAVPTMFDLAMSAVGYGKQTPGDDTNKPKSRKKRSPGFADIFLRDATRSAFDKEVGPEECKPYESSFSEGCPPVDWCIGCTVCDCDANGRWDCHVLSFCDDDDKKRIKLDKKKKLRRKEYMKRESRRHMTNDLLGNSKMKDKSSHKIGSYATTKQRAQRKALETKKLVTVSKKKGTHGKPHQKQAVRKPLRRIHPSYPTTTPKYNQSATKVLVKKRVLINKRNKTQEQAVLNKIDATTTKIPIKPTRKRVRIRKGDLQISKRSIESTSSATTTSTQSPPPAFMVPSTPEGKAFKKVLIQSISKMLEDNRKMEKRRRLENEIKELHKKAKKLKRYKRSLTKKVKLRHQAYEAEKKVIYNKTISVPAAKRKRHNYISEIAPNMMQQNKRFTRHVVGPPGNITVIGKTPLLQNILNESALILPTMQTYYQYTVENSTQNTTTVQGLGSTTTIVQYKNESDKNSTKRSISGLDIGEEFKQPSRFSNIESRSVFFNEAKPLINGSVNVLVQTTVTPTEINNNSNANFTTTDRATYTVITLPSNIKEREEPLPITTEMVFTTTPLTTSQHFEIIVTEETEVKKEKEIFSTTPRLVDIMKTVTDSWNTLPNNIMKTTVVNNHTTVLFNIPETKPKVSSKSLGRKIGGLYKKRTMKKLIQTLNDKAWRDEKINLYTKPEVITVPTGFTDLYNATIKPFRNKGSYKKPPKSKTKSLIDLKKFFIKIFHGFQEPNNSSTHHKTKGNKMLKYLQKFVRKLLSRGNSNHQTFSKTDTKKASDRQRIIETLCETFGPCKEETFQKEKLLKKIDELNEKTYDMFNSIKMIKSLLHLIDFNKNRSDLKDQTQAFKEDIHKLNSILKDTYMKENQIHKQNNSQALKIGYIKANVQIFSSTAGKFADILSEIIDWITPHQKNNKKRSLKQNNIQHFNVSSTTKQKQPLTKLKDLLIRYNMVQNVFMKKIFDALVSLNPNDKVTYNNTKIREPDGDKNVQVNKKPEALQVYAKNIINNLRRLKHLAQGFDIDNMIKKNNNKVRRKRHLEDDDSMEYLLVLMQYLLKKSAQQDLPVNDGIDLIIEGIKQAPDIKSIKKKILINAVTPPLTATTQSSNIGFWRKSFNTSREYNDSDISDNNKIVSEYSKQGGANIKGSKESVENNQLLMGNINTEPYSFSRDDIEEEFHSKAVPMLQALRYPGTSEVMTTARAFSPQQENPRKDMAPDKSPIDEMYETLAPENNNYYIQVDPSQFISEDNVQESGMTTSGRPYSIQKDTPFIEMDITTIANTDNSHKDIFSPKVTLNSGAKYYKKDKEDLNEVDNIESLDDRYYVQKEIDDAKKEFDFDKFANRIDNSGQRSSEINNGEMDEEDLSEFPTEALSTKVLESTTKKYISKNSEGDTSSSQMEKIQLPDWFDEKYEGENMAPTQLKKKKGIKKLNLIDKNTGKDKINLDSGSISSDSITRENEETRQKRVNTKEDLTYKEEREKEDLLYKKEMDLLNSLDYRQGNEGMDDRSQSKELLHDKYAGDAFSPFFE